MPAENGDWLEDENPFQSFDDRTSGVQKQENKAEALRFAQKYHATFSNGAGRDLLEYWSRMVRLRRIAPNAPATELAYHNGVREFVEGIHAQIAFATNGGTSPYRER